MLAFARRVRCESVAGSQNSEYDTKTGLLEPECKLGTPDAKEECLKECSPQIGKDRKMLMRGKNY